MLNGQKVFITGGAYADLVTLFATLEPEGGGAGRVDRDWTCFVVERGTTGFRTGRREHKLGQRAADATELFLDDVFVPSANLVGTERSGWAINRNVLNYSRLPVGRASPSGSLAAPPRPPPPTAAGPVSAGSRFSPYQEVQLTLADLWLETMAMRAMVWQGARHIPPAQGISSAVKTFCGDRAVAVAARAIEVLADDGAHVAGGVEKRFRDGRLNQIYEGTNQLNRLALVEALWETDLAGGPVPARLRRRRWMSCGRRERSALRRRHLAAHPDSEGDQDTRRNPQETQVMVRGQHVRSEYLLCFSGGVLVLVDQACRTGQSRGIACSIARSNIRAGSTSSIDPSIGARHLTYLRPGAWSGQRHQNRATHQVDSVNSDADDVHTPRWRMPPGRWLSHRVTHGG